MTTGKEILQTTSLDIGYRMGGSSEKVLFRNLNLSLQAGKMVCFMGPNGSGKSTLIRTLAGLHPPLRGSFSYGDRSNVSSPNLTTWVSVVLTDRIPSVNLTVRELITYGRYPYLNWTIRQSQDDIAWIEKALDQLRLRDLEDKTVYELSDGQLQMAMIGRTLAQDTPVILLDEPTAHLDLNNRVEIMNLLRKLAHETNKAILISTHDLDLALQTADLIWLSGEGSKMILGVPEDLVLEGKFDEIFKLKGFDLKTGKVKHEVSRTESIRVTGEGHYYLWTKNALERNGYRIDDENPDCHVTVIGGDAPLWNLRKRPGQPEIKLATIKDLLGQLQTIAAD